MTAIDTIVVMLVACVVVVAVMTEVAARYPVRHMR